MGRLTADTTRLVGEIHAAHSERLQMRQALRRATTDLKCAVARMQAGSFLPAHLIFHRTHAAKWTEIFIRWSSFTSSPDRMQGSVSIPPHVKKRIWSIPANGATSGFMGWTFILRAGFHVQNFVSVPAWFRKAAACSNSTGHG